MLSFSCDVCKQVIPDVGHLCDLIETRLVVAEDGPPKLVDRGSIFSLYICGACAAAVRQTLDARRPAAQAAPPG